MTVLDQLDQVLEARKSQDPDESYVASLYAAGLNKILEKVGEEATEAIIAAKDAQAQSSVDNKRAVAAEVADVWFHTLVALHHLDLDSTDVLNVLQDRFGIGGLEEKAGRTKK